VTVHVFDAMSIEYSELVRARDAVEALAWLREAKTPEERTITGGDGEGWRGDEAIAVVQELYRLGAVRVTAVKIDGRVEKDRCQNTCALIVELPGDTGKRSSLFAWQGDFARKLDWDPTPDDGQDYLLIWRD
jgi:hypothetical protein